MAAAIILRKEHILFTTIDVMNEQGVLSFSTREIAKREGVSEGTIFKHFAKKSDLIMAVLNYYSQYDESIFESCRLKNQSPIEGIRYILEIYATYYQSYPAITVITQAFDEMKINTALEEKVRTIMQSRHGFIKGLIDEAREANEMSRDLDSEALADIIMSSFNGICLKWRMANYDFSLKENILQTVDLLLKQFTISTIYEQLEERKI